MSTRSFTTSVELCVNGNACEREATVHYEFEAAGGDGWTEPRHPAGATVCEVECWYEGADKLARALDLLPLLTKECIASLVGDCLQHEAGEREYRKSEAADARRDFGSF